MRERRAESRIEAETAADGFEFQLAGERLTARASGALWLPERSALAVADLHLGKSERMARRGGPLLPPYETADTIERLATEIARLEPRMVISLGDSFDDARAADALGPAARERLGALAEGRDWVWIAGNHDPAAPAGLGGRALEELALGRLRFRHIASAGAMPGAVSRGEVSGHHHPKATLIARGRRLSRRCFLWDARRLILPAFGLYTGGLDARDPAFDALLEPDAVALLIGRRAQALPRAALSAARGASGPGFDGPR
ncbi:MAG: ligase-associated DNA damage response endonuclease PdeM [Pseudomonadota bacterium]